MTTRLDQIKKINQLKLGARFLSRALAQGLNYEDWKVSIDIDDFHDKTVIIVRRHFSMERSVHFVISDGEIKAICKSKYATDMLEMSKIQAHIEKWLAQPLTQNDQEIEK